MLLRQLFAIAFAIITVGSIPEVNAASTVAPQVEVSLDREELLDYVLNLIPENTAEEEVIEYAIRVLEDESTDDPATEPTPRCKTGQFYPTPDTGISWGSCKGKLKYFTICVGGTCKSWM